MIGLKRWMSALVAVVFLATAAIHEVAHSALNEAACAVCQISLAALPAAPSPSVAVSPIPEVAVVEAAAFYFVSHRVAVGEARAPPAILA